MNHQTPSPAPAIRDSCQRIRRLPLIDRRRFLSMTSLALAGMTGQCDVAECHAAVTESNNFLLFLSRGQTGIVDLKTLQVKYLHVEAPNQVTWQVSAVFPDRRRLVLLSMEPRRDGPGKPFEEYYTQTPTHLWLYDLESGRLEEICQRDRLAPFMTPALLIDEERILVQVVKNKVGQIFSMRIDGSDAREFTKAGEGLPYGMSLSPDKTRVAFHLASPQGYQVFTSDLEGQHRVQVAAAPGHLYFGTQWSPDGQSILYVDCLAENDPGHDWADVCVGAADGGSHRVLTQNQSMWFAATYGDQQTRGGGSNVPAWTTDGTIVYPRRSPGAKVPWQYRVGQPDLDHFNRDYRPEAAVGGVQLCELNPTSGQTEELTPLVDGIWDFRGNPSPDGKYLAFCRAKTGEAPQLWLMERASRQTRLVTRGVDDLGADHPRW